MHLERPVRVEVQRIEVQLDVAGLRIVGIDDVRYAALLPVPLTTIRQPCREIGETALRMLLDHTPRFAPLITHKRTLEQIASAFALLEKYDDGVGKILIIT